MNLSAAQLSILRTFAKRGILSPDDAAYWMGEWTNNIRPNIEELMNCQCLRIWADADTWAQTLLMLTDAGRAAIAEHAKTQPVGITLKGKVVAS